MGRGYMLQFLVHTEIVCESVVDLECRYSYLVESKSVLIIREGSMTNPLTGSAKAPITNR